MTQRPKIIRLITRLNIGGPALHTILLTEELAANGFASLLVTGCAASEEGDMLELLKTQSLKPIIIPELGREINIIRDLIAFVKVYLLLKREKPQIVHTHTAKAGLVGRWAARWAKVPIIIHTFHGHVFHSYFGPLKTKLFIWLERWTARFTTQIIAVSESVKRDLIKYKIVSPDNITVIPLGFKLERFLEAQPGNLRQELKIDTHTKLVGIVGRLVPIKNHRLFFQAAQIVVRTYPETKFIVVGEGELSNNLQNYTRELGVNDCTIFLGWRNDLPAIYSDLDVVVLSSFNEGTPVSLIEGMACGCPIVSTQVGGVADVVQDNAHGYLINSLTPQALAEAIIKLLNNPEQARQMGQCGKQKIESLYTSQRLINDITRLYNYHLNKIQNHS